MCTRGSALCHAIFTPTINHKWKECWNKLFFTVTHGSNWEETYFSFNYTIYIVLQQCQCLHHAQISPQYLCKQQSHWLLHILTPSPPSSGVILTKGYTFENLTFYTWTIFRYLNLVLVKLVLQVVLMIKWSIMIVHKLLVAFWTDLDQTYRLFQAV